jgi:AcrR family transcriptional regulator
MQAATRDLEIENQVLDAVDRLLARGAYGDMAMEHVARETGITVSKLYLHFRTKEDILLAHCDRIVLRIVAVEKAIAAQPHPAPFRIRQILIFRVLAYFDSVQHFAESLDDVFRDIRTELFERRQIYSEWETNVIESILRESGITSAWTANGISGTARALLAATDSLLPFNCISSELGTRRQLAKRAEKVTDLVIKGLFEAPKARNDSSKVLTRGNSFSSWTRMLL